MTQPKQTDSELDGSRLGIGNNPLTLVFWILVLGCAEALAVELCVAPNGSDSAMGNAGAPYATIQRARDEIRRFKKAGSLREPVTVLVRGGTYYLPEALVFEPQDSGTAQAPIVYEAARGEEPILSGGALLTGWREVAPGRWETTLPDVAAGNWYFSQLYVNDQRRFRPVLPKQGYYFIAGQASPSQGVNHDRFQFVPGNLCSDWHNLGDVEITTFHLWTMDRLPLKAVDEDGHVATLAGPTHSREQAPLAPPTWFRAENVREALSEPGEWYLDRRTGVLSYLAKPGEDMRRARVVAPRLKQLVQFSGDVDKGLVVEHITLRGLTLAHSGWEVPPRGYGCYQAEAELDGTLSGRNAQECALEQCVIRHTGNYAVDLGAGCRKCRVECCELFDLGGGGIKLGTFQFDEEPDAKKWAGECAFRDNLIAHGGRLHPGGVGVLIGHAANNVIEHNEVADFYYMGISVGWRWSKGFSPATNNTVAFNHIYDIGQQVISDGAGIYMLGQSPGTVARFNRIHDVTCARYGGWGIYFDAESSGIVAENNLVYRAGDAAFAQTYGSNNTLRNNIFAFGGKAQLQLGDLNLIKDPKRPNRIHVERNIFCWRDGALFSPSPEDDPVSFDGVTFKGNLYFTAGVRQPFAFEKWREREPDAVVADPWFVAPAEGDFGFRPKSPALKAGFVPFDVRNAGPQAKLKRTAKLPSPPGPFPPAPATRDN